MALSVCEGEFPGRLRCNSLKTNLTEDIGYDTLLIGCSCTKMHAGEYLQTSGLTESPAVGRKGCGSAERKKTLRDTPAEVATPKWPLPNHLAPSKACRHHS